MNQQEKSEQRLSLVIAAIVFGLFLTNLAYLIQNRIGISYTIISNICKALIVIALLFCIRIFVARFNRFLLVFLFLLALVSLLQMAIFRRNTTFLRTLSTFLTNVFPAVLVFSVIRDCKKPVIILRQTALLISAILLIANLTRSLSYFEAEYAMGFANCMTLPTIILIEELFNDRPPLKFSIVLILAIICNVFTVVIYGSRGAFVAILVFILYLIIKQMFTKRRAGYLIAIAVLLLIAVFYNSILNFSMDFLMRQGLSSRTLSILLTNATHDSGRLALWSELLREIADNPFAIRGINADYLLIGSYSHNFFTELIYAFGTVAGGFFSIYIIVKIVKSILNGFRDDESRLEILLLFSYFPVCLWSGSIWTSMYFWAWFTLIHATKHISAAKEMRIDT